MTDQPSTPPQRPRVTLTWTQLAIGLIALSVLGNLISGAMDVPAQPKPIPPAQVVQAQSPTPPASPAAEPTSRHTETFDIVKVKVSDSSAKTQIEVWAVMTADPRTVTAEQVRSYLEAIYADKASFDAAMWVDKQQNKATLRDLEREWGVSLKHFNFAREINLASSRHTSTHFYAMVYFNEQEAKQSMSNWVGRLAWREGTGAHELEVKDARIADAHNPDTKKFGLTKEQRMQLFKDEIAGSRKADDASVQKYPDDVMKQISYDEKQRDKRRNELAKKYRITTKQLEEVLSEGLHANWPKP